MRGKTFDDVDGYNTAIHYGKSIFAHQVVRPRADTISFAGFLPLLTNVAAVITAHTASVARVSVQHAPK